MIKTRWGFGLAGAVLLGVVGIVGLGASAHVPAGLARVVFVRPDPVPAWVQRVALVDEAISRADLSRAIYEWREAYGAALGSGRSEALIAVGDRAVRIAALGGGPGDFTTEARHVYVHAALRARAERSRDTILGIAERLERLGDAERAAQVRRIETSVSLARSILGAC
jgi:hypothetical protein